MSALFRGYQVIYVDPPWSYNDKQTNRPEHYSRTTLRDLKAMRVKDIASQDSALLMWSTMPMLPVAIDLMGAWGYAYKTCAFTWVKLTKSGSPAVGMGHYTRSNAELCLLGTRGKPKVLSHSVRSVVMSQREAHSKKPSEVRDRIVDLFGDVRRIELFARGPVSGWCTAGDEAEHSCVDLSTGLIGAAPCARCASGEAAAVA